MLSDTSSKRSFNVLDPARAGAKFGNVVSCIDAMHQYTENLQLLNMV
jgi:hypothetical protein